MNTDNYNTELNTLKYIAQRNEYKDNLIEKLLLLSYRQHKKEEKTTKIINT